MGFNKALLLGMFMVTLVFLGLSGFLLSAASSYNVTVDPEYQDIFDEYEASNELYQTNQEIIQGGEINPEGQDQAVYKNVIVSGKQLQNSGNLFLKFSGQIPKIMGIDAGIMAVIVTIVFALGTFGFIFLISGRTP